MNKNLKQLVKFTNEEQASFIAYLESPFFGKYKRLVGICQFAFAEKEKTNPDYTIENISSKLKKSEKYIENLCTEIGAIYPTFWSFYALKQDKAMQNQNLLDYLDKNGEFEMLDFYWSQIGV